MITVTFRSARDQTKNTPEKPDYYLVNWRVYGSPPVWRPPTDLIELEDHYLVRVEIAGMSEKDFSIVLDQTILSIHGIRYDIPDRRAYHQMEVNMGEFDAVVEIPGMIDREKATAAYENGFLLVTLPKSEPKQIHINE